MNGVPRHWLTIPTMYSQLPWELDTSDWPLIISETPNDGRVIATMELPEGSTGSDGAGLSCVATADHLIALHNESLTPPITLDDVPPNLDTEALGVEIVTTANGTRAIPVPVLVRWLEYVIARDDARQAATYVAARDLLYVLDAAEAERFAAQQGH